MTAAIALYALGIAGLVSVAAWIIERLCALRAWPRRGVWCAALVLSWTYPIAAIWIAQSAPLPTPVPAQALGTPAALAPEQTAQFVVILPDAAPAGWRVSDFDNAVPVIWVLSSAGLLGLFGLATYALRRRSRGWRWHEVDGHIVLITECEGPAVMGFLNPEILFPTWLLEESRRTRAMVLAHEQQHIAARDPLLLVGAFLLLALAPWNIPLWWQLRRLRFAIEVDCDARASGGAKRIVPYAEALIAVSRRRPAIGFGAALALTTRRSQLERRVRILTAEPDRRLTPTTLAIAAAVALLASFSQWQPPQFSLDLWQSTESLPFKPEPTSADSEISALFDSSRDVPEVLVRGSVSHGLLWFERQRLTDVVSKLNRHNRTKIIIADPSIADLRFGGGFENNDVDAFVRALERTWGIRRLPSLDGDRKRNEVLLVSAKAYAAQQETDRERDFRIRAGPLASAFAAFATQSRMSILFDPLLLSPEYRTIAIRGRMKPVEALLILLQGTGCDFQRVPPSTMTISCPQKPILQPLDFAPVLSGFNAGPTEDVNSNSGPKQLILRGLGAGSALVLVNGHRLSRLDNAPRDSVVTLRTLELITNDEVPERLTLFGYGTSAAR